MNIRFPLIQRFACFCAALLLLTNTATSQPQTAVNLQVLPFDTTRQELNAVMVENLLGLGLPRRQSEGCLYCHAGSMDMPASEWDYASDDKTTKRKAREMMAMVQEINQRLQSLEDRIAPNLEVTCYTCHAGRTDPRPLPELLLGSYRENGIDEMVAHYQTLRQRYVGGDAYDFRVNTLVTVATELVAENQLDDAIVIARLNQELFEESPQASFFTLTLEIEQVVRRDGLDAGFEFFDGQRSSSPQFTDAWPVLDGLGWQYYRSNRQQLALQIFRKNKAVFPDDYVPNESLADALWFTDQAEARQESLAIFLAWLERNPDHAMAQRRLATLRSQN